MLGTSFVSTEHPDTIEVTETFEDVAAMLLQEGEFILVTDAEDEVPIVLRRSLIDLAMPTAALKEVEETKEPA